MNWTERRKLAVLMAFHVLWGFVLWLSISKYGLGVSTDSAAYMFAGLNWSEGRGLISYDGSLYQDWPPLYPMLMGFIHILTGANMLLAAAILQFLAFALVSFFTSVLFLRIFPENFLFAFLACFIFDTGQVVVSTFQMVGTDYLFILFPVLLALLAAEYLRTQKLTMVLLLALVASLAGLLRHVGYTVVLAAGLIVLLYTQGGWLKRLLRSLWVALLGLAPALSIWQVWASTDRRAPLTLPEYFAQFTNSILGWFFNEATIEARPALYSWGLWLVIAGMIPLLSFLSKKRSIFTEFTGPVLGYGLLYTVALFANASIAYFNKLRGRLLLPVYIPLILLFLLCLELLWQYLRQQVLPVAVHRLLLAAGVLLIVLVNLPLLRGTTEAMLLARGGTIPENIYNTQDWNENAALQYWHANPPKEDYLLFGNYHPGVAFHTWHIAYPSPRKYAGPYSQAVIPLSQYESVLFGSGLDVYLIWIEPNEYSHLYTVDELSLIARVEPLFVSDAGGIYRLLPSESGR